MTHRSQRSPQERDARSRAVQLLADKPLLRGSLVRQHRSCGKPSCRCQKGQKQPALYLNTRCGNQRVRIYIPPAPTTPPAGGSTMAAGSNGSSIASPSTTSGPCRKRSR
jgi:hypothetical protein